MRSGLGVVTRIRRSSRLFVTRNLCAVHDLQGIACAHRGHDVTTQRSRADPKKFHHLLTSRALSSKVDKRTNWPVKMPNISEDEKFGTVTAWHKKEGEKISKGQDLCELEFTNFTINLNVEEDSYVAQILVPEGSEQVPVGVPLCVMVENEEDIPLYREVRAPKVKEAGKLSFEERDVMLTINDLLKSGSINQDLATRLLSLARHENLELYKAFTGSLKGKTYEEGGIDTDLFLLQAKDIAKEHFRQPPPSQPQG